MPLRLYHVGFGNTILKSIWAETRAEAIAMVRKLQDEKERQPVAYYTAWYSTHTKHISDTAK